MKSLIQQNFNEDLEYGEKYETKWIRHLLCNNRNTRYERAIPGFKEWDVKVLYPQDSCITFEIKADRIMERTGNIAIEIWSNYELNTTGWIWYSKADFLIYFESEEVYYICTLFTLRNWVLQYAHLYETKTASLNGNPNARCLIVPIQNLLGTVFKRRMLNEKN